MVVGEFRLRRLAQPVGRRGFIAGHLPVDHPHLIGVGDPVAVIVTVTEQVFQPVQVATGIIEIAARQRALDHQRQTLQLLLRLIS